MTSRTDTTVKAAIEQVYDTWIAAVRKQDLDTIISLYTDDVLAFDAIMALQFKGKEAYRKHWQTCMEFCPAKEKEPFFEIHELVVQSEGDLAFAHALMRCGFKEGDKIDASWMRMSSGLRRHNGEWKIAHEHFSAPFEMPSGKAMFYLSPDDSEHTVRPVPPGMSTISAHLVCADAPAAIEFYKKAFNAMETPLGQLEMDGVFMHGELAIGDSMIMIAQENADCGMRAPHSLNGTPVSLHLYVPDVDRAFQRAVEAGAKEIMPVTDMFWGDRYGVVEDPEGHRWSMATHLRDMSPEEIQQGAREFFVQMAK